MGRACPARAPSPQPRELLEEGTAPSEEPGLAHGVTGITGRARGWMMWEELGVTGMLSHVGWALSTGDEAARQSSPAASCDTADVPSRVRHPRAGLAPDTGPRHLAPTPLAAGPPSPVHTSSSTTLRAANPSSPFPGEASPKFASLSLVGAACAASALR